MLRVRRVVRVWRVLRVGTLPGVWVSRGFRKGDISDSV